MERPISLTQREHFLVDPVFEQCWTLMERERFLPPEEKTETKGTFVEKDGNPIIELPWRWNNLGCMLEYIRTKATKDEKSAEVETWKFSYKILLDVQHFSPSELSITVTDRTIVVKGKHEERDDPDGAVSREFSRKYILPADAHMDGIECDLSSDGVLHITAPRNLSVDKSPRRQSLKDSIKSTFSSFINFKNTNVTEGKVIHPPPEGKENPSPLADEPIQSSVQGLSDFDRIPFWSRQSLDNSQFGIKSDRDMFKTLLDVREYTPEELTVYKIPHHILVEGTHEDLPDEHGLIRHYFHFTRKYFLPSSVNAESIRSRWSWTGTLEITAPKSNNHQENEMVTLVPILVGEIPSSPSESKITQQSPINEEINAEQQPTTEDKKMEHTITEEKKSTELPVMHVEKLELPLLEDQITKHSVNEEKKTEFPDMEVRKIERASELKADVEKNKADYEEIGPTTELPKDEHLPLSDDLKPVMGEKFVKQLSITEIVNTLVEDCKPEYEDVKMHMEEKRTEKHSVSEDDTIPMDEETMSRKMPVIAPGFRMK